MLKDFKDFSLALGMLSATTNATKFAQVYQKLAKIGQICRNLLKDN
jgi:hypothetical protein